MSAVTDPAPRAELDRPSGGPGRLLRLLALLGPVVFAALFVARAVRPFDAILGTIAVALVATTAGVVAGRRWAGWAYLVFPIAVFTTPAIGELSFNLSAIDSAAWRWHAIVSLVALGLATVTALVVALRGVGSRADGGDPGSAAAAVSLVGGSALGLLLLAVTPSVVEHPGFGADLGDAELAALPTIDLLNYRYEAATITVDGAGLERFRLDNPSDLPHTVTIDALDVEVYVPAGRWAVLEFDAAPLTESVAFHCSVGDHRDLGMSGVLSVDPVG